MTDRPCVTCGNPVDPAKAHYPHKHDCPNRLVGARVDCTCDLIAHPECCPECRWE